MRTDAQRRKWNRSFLEKLGIQRKRGLAEFRSDDEQLELIRRWWSENARSVLISVAVAALAVFGWYSWQNSRAAALQAAHETYSSFRLSFAEDSAEARDTALHLADQLLAEHPNSGFTSMAWLRLARLAVDDGDMGAAESRLRTALESATLYGCASRG